MGAVTNDTLVQGCWHGLLLDVQASQSILRHRMNLGQGQQVVVAEPLGFCRRNQQRDEMARGAHHMASSSSAALSASG